MNKMYLVTSLTNWTTDSSLANALKASYTNRLCDKSEIIIVDNNIVESFGQFSVQVKDQYKNDYFALKLVINNKTVPKSITDKFEELTAMLYSAGLDLIADEFPCASQEVVEVYAINYEQSKLLTTFDSHEDNMLNIEYELENCDEAYRILNISSAKDD